MIGLTRQLLLRCLMGMIVLLAVGCERKAPEPELPDVPVVEPMESLTAVDPLQQAATEAIWNTGLSLLEQVLNSQADLHRALQTLLAAPSDEALTEAQSAWRRSHENWHRLDPLLALADSSPGLFAGLQEAVFNIDAHPLLPGYLDAVAAYPYSGIVNDISLTINASTLRAQHGLTDPGDVAIGFHAMEFLLWGEHGQRQPRDFALIQETTAEQRSAGLNIADLPNNRRRDMLLLLSHLLKDDIGSLLSHWRGPQGGLYRTYHQLHPAVRAQLWKNAALHYLGQARHLLEQALHPEVAAYDGAHSAFARHNLAPIAAGLNELHRLLSDEQSALPWFSEPEFGERWLAALASTINRMQTAAETPPTDEQRDQLLSDLGTLQLQLAAEYEQHL